MAGKPKGGGKRVCKIGKALRPGEMGRIEPRKAGHKKAVPLQYVRMANKQYGAEFEDKKINGHKIDAWVNDYKKRFDALEKGKESLSRGRLPKESLEAMKKGARNMFLRVETVDEKRIVFELELKRLNERVHDLIKLEAADTKEKFDITLLKMFKKRPDAPRLMAIAAPERDIMAALRFSGVDFKHELVDVGGGHKKLVNKKAASKMKHYAKRLNLVETAIRDIEEGGRMSVLRGESAKMRERLNLVETARHDIEEGGRMSVKELKALDKSIQNRLSKAKTKGEILALLREESEILAGEINSVETEMRNTKKGSQMSVDALKALDKSIQNQLINAKTKGEILWLLREGSEMLHDKVNDFGRLESADKKVKFTRILMEIYYKEIWKRYWWAAR